MEELYQNCLGKVARVWCKPHLEHKVMDAELALEFTQMLFVQAAIIQALISDKAEGNRAKEYAVNYMNGLRK